MTGDLAHRATAPGGTVRRDSGPEGTDTAGWCPASAPRACVVAVADDEIADTIPAVMMQLAVSALAVRAPFAMRSAATTRTSVLQMSTYATFKTTKGDFKVRRAGFWVPQRGPHAMSGECNPNGTLPALCLRSLTSPLLSQAELFMDKLPITSSNFADLAKSGFYDGLSFHRVINVPAAPAQPARPPSAALIDVPRTWPRLGIGRHAAPLPRPLPTICAAASPAGLHVPVRLPSLQGPEVVPRRDRRPGAGLFLHHPGRHHHRPEGR